MLGLSTWSQMLKKLLLILKLLTTFFQIVNTFLPRRIIIISFKLVLEKYLQNIDPEMLSYMWLI